MASQVGDSRLWWTFSPHQHFLNLFSARCNRQRTRQLFLAPSLLTIDPLDYTSHRAHTTHTYRQISETNFPPNISKLFLNFAELIERPFSVALKWIPDENVRIVCRAIELVTQAVLFDIFCLVFSTTEAEGRRRLWVDWTIVLEQRGIDVHVLLHTRRIWWSSRNWSKFLSAGEMLLDHTRFSWVCRD